MSPTLRNMLFATSVVVGGFAVYLIAPGTDANDVKLTALGQGCVARAAETEFAVTDEGRAWLADAGIVAPEYVRLQFPVGLCPDAGAAILPDLPYRKLRFVRLESADVTACGARPGVCALWGNSRPFKVVSHRCAWKPNASADCMLRRDGGTVDPGVENTMQPGDFVGTGCVLKSCTEIAGETSAP